MAVGSEGCAVVSGNNHRLEGKLGTAKKYSPVYLFRMQEGQWASYILFQLFFFPSAIAVSLLLVALQSFSNTNKDFLKVNVVLTMSL